MLSTHKPAHGRLIQRPLKLETTGLERYQTSHQEHLMLLQMTRVWFPEPLSGSS